MTLKIKLLFTICFVFGLALASPCHAWQNEIPAYLKGICLYAPDPEYPMTLARKGIGGEGRFRLIIDPRTGQVTEVKVLKSTGFTILNVLAAKAFLQWKFRPGTVTQQAVTFDFHVIGYGRELH